MVVKAEKRSKPSHQESEKPAPVAFTVSFQKIIYENLLVTDVARVGRELMILGGWSVLTLVGGMKAFKW